MVFIYCMYVLVLQYGFRLEFKVIENVIQLECYEQVMSWCVMCLVVDMKVEKIISQSFTFV